LVDGRDSSPSTLRRFANQTKKHFVGTNVG
jgi:hypothetical protein